MTEEIKQLKLENELLKKLLYEQSRLSDNLPQENRVLFVDFYSQWLSYQKDYIQSSTFFEYERIYNNYIIPYFKPKKKYLDEITAIDIQNYYKHLKRSRGMSNNSVIRHHANLHTCFKYAYRENYVTYSIMDKVERPKANKPKVYNTYDIDELIDLFAVAKDSNIYTPVLLGGLLGVRRSEAIALKWDVINFKNGTITVKRKMTRDKTKRKDVISQNLKNEASERTLVLPEFLLTHLQELKIHNQSIKKKSNIEFICVDPDGSLPTLNSITNRFRFLINSNGLKKIRFHDLRHSCATMLYSLGYSIKDIQEWLGHSNYSTTANIYTHIGLAEKGRIAKRLDEIFKK